MSYIEVCNHIEIMIETEEKGDIYILYSKRS